MKKKKKKKKELLSEIFQLWCMVKFSIYSKTSMARTPLGPWKFIRDMGSSGH